MKIVHLAVALALGIAPSVALAVPTCPPVGSATAGCDITITVTSGGTIIALGPSAGIAGGTYDGSDDTLIGIENDLGTTLSSIDLSSTTDIFGFDGDGLTSFSGGVGNIHDSTGYGGPDSFFTNIHNSFTAGTVNFFTPLAANGGTTYFGLEEKLSPTQIVVTGTGAVPEPSTLLMMGTGIAGFAGALRRKFVK